MPKESEPNPDTSLPECPEAELGTLGCCFQQPDFLQVCIGAGLTPEKFATPLNRFVWELLAEIGSKGIAADGGDMLALCFGELRKRRGLMGVAKEMRAHLLELSKLGWSYRGDAFLGDVLDYANRREAIAESISITNRLLEAGTLAEIQAEIMPAVSRLNNMAMTERDETLATVAARVRENIKNLAEGKQLSGTTINIGLADADKHLHGLNSKRDFITVLAARPSVGKTSLATQIMQQALVDLKDKAVIVDFQLENSRDNHVAQMGARFAQMDLAKPGGWTEKQREAFDKYVARIQEVADKHLYVYEHDTTIEQIEARLRFIKRKHGYVSFVVIDYIQLVGSMDPSLRDERKVINFVSRRLKLLAKEIGCPFLVLAQLSREFEKDGREPQLRDIKESGNIEADADRVWFLHIPKNAKPDPQTNCIETWLIQRKNKYGPTGKVKLTHKRPTTTFYMASNQTDDKSSSEEDSGI